MIKRSDAMGICWRLSHVQKLAQVKLHVFEEMGQWDKWGHWNVFNEDEIDFTHKDVLMLNEFYPPPQDEIYRSFQVVNL